MLGDRPHEIDWSIIMTTPTTTTRREFFRDAQPPLPHFQENLRRLERGEPLLERAPDAKP